MTRFTVNGERREFNGDETMPLLWYLREEAGTKGVKYGCGIAQCGACTVHVNGAAIRSCVTPVSSVDGAEITTIEGLADGENLHPVQQAWIEEDVPQCGYCQAGQIMAVAALLENNPEPSDEDINNGVTNICRCGTYFRLRKAIHRAAALKKGGA
ncbi:(2Fe-2S)-binding protein [Hyphococcus flavus]|uniref:(2Fe-2S)-binding protein n=1 Tax=Hyphococcus flavus TaxID=1866326 RepID=A0AAE9ZFC5_9PROT|nr:(2Fe-2S)-binding protein [Hyphococcus flavus]WDI32765.1 (2Fe-2S)-binding protein [Hyphococcus flavus]